MAAAVLVLLLWCGGIIAWLSIDIIGLPLAVLWYWAFVQLLCLGTMSLCMMSTHDQ